MGLGNYMQSHDKRFSKGFTLVELAVVLTIIALLIGGVLKGQEMIEDARVVSTVSQVHGYEAATLTFKKTYGDLPGDMPNAESRLPNCPDCDPQAGLATTGDGWIGRNNTLFVSGNGTNSSAAWVFQSYSSPSGDRRENRLFWGHLFAAGLITGITTTDISEPANFGTTLPAAKIGGGFLIGSIADRDASFSRMEGILLALVATEQASTSTRYLLTPLRAAQIDRKMDDGFPVSGNVQDASMFYRVPNTTTRPPGSPCRDLTPEMEEAGLTDLGYLEGEETSNTCNLVFKMRD